MRIAFNRFQCLAHKESIYAHVCLRLMCFYVCFMTKHTHTQNDNETNHVYLSIDSIMSGGMETGRRKQLQFVNCMFTFNFWTVSIEQTISCDNHTSWIQFRTETWYDLICPMRNNWKVVFFSNLFAFPPKKKIVQIYIRLWLSPLNTFLRIMLIMICQTQHILSSILLYSKTLPFFKGPIDKITIKRCPEQIWQHEMCTHANPMC